MRDQADVQPQQLTQIALLWKGAYEVEGPQDKTVQALAIGRNFRINVAKALEAAYSTAKVFIEGSKIYAGQLAGVDWLGLGVETVHAITSVFSALVESMPPLNYVACVMLSGHPKGASASELRDDIVAFLKNPKAKQLPWYLYMSKGLISDAQSATNAPDWFPQLLDDLRKDDWLVEDGQTLKYKSRNFELKSKFAA